jgi:hypothetical protein
LLRWEWHVAPLLRREWHVVPTKHLLIMVE